MAGPDRANAAKANTLGYYGDNIKAYMLLYIRICVYILRSVTLYSY